MGCHPGLVRFESDGSIWHYDYNSTADVCISHIYKTSEELSEHYRKHEWKTCTCGKKERVSIYSSYGGGFMMEGFACKECKSLIEDTDEYNCTIMSDYLEPSVCDHIDLDV